MNISRLLGAIGFVALVGLVLWIAGYQTLLSFEKAKLLAECKTKIRLATGDAINPLWQIGDPYSSIGIYRGKHQFLFTNEAFRAWQIFDAKCECESTRGCGGDIRWVQKPQSACLIDTTQDCSDKQTKF